MQVDGRTFYAAGTNGYVLALVSDGTQYGFTDAALEGYFAEQVCCLSCLRCRELIDHGGPAVARQKVILLLRRSLMHSC